MTTNRICIIGAASGVGAKDHGCEDGPVAFHRSQAWHELERHPLIDWGRTRFAQDMPGHAQVERVADICHELAGGVAGTLAAGAFPLLIGVDHSVTIGMWSGVARFISARLDLLWIDAHLDSHTPETSYYGAIHGMPLACLLGRGDKRLLGKGIPGVQVSPQPACPGNRRIQPGQRSPWRHCASDLGTDWRDSAAIDPPAAIIRVGAPLKSPR